MSLSEVTTTWEEQFQSFAGLDRRTDRSLVGIQHLTDANNIVLERGILKTRLGSTRWGTLSLEVGSGTYWKMILVDVGDADYVLFHRGTSLWYGLKTDGLATIITAIGGGSLDVVDEESEFETIGYTVGASGERVVKVLFKQMAGCKELQFDSTTGVWTGLNAGISTAGLSFVVTALPSGGPPNAAGTYRIRIVAQRRVGDVRTSESASTGLSTAFDTDIGYQEVEATLADPTIAVSINYFGLDPQVTHFQVQATKVLEFAPGSNYSSNGNDPTIFFESESVAVDNTGSQLVYLDLADENLVLVCPDLIGYEPLPGHLISVYAGGILFFGGIPPYQSRIYYSGLSGYYYHNTLYNPLTWIPADEGDGQLLTDLELVGDHIAVFKEGKTAILPNKNVESPLVWRDKRIGSLHRDAAANISEAELIVLCQDGILRLFDGIQYTNKPSVAGSSFDFSDYVRPITEAIDPSTVSYIWHRERLHLLHGETGDREALVLHPREGYGWTQWTGLDHELNGMIDNGNSWVFLHDGVLWEQSPYNPVYVDYDEDLVEWAFTMAPLRPKNERLKIWLVGSAMEGSFANAIEAVFRTDGGFITTQAVNAAPDPSLLDFQYVQWFKLYPAQQVYGQYIELILSGEGQAVFRKKRWNVIEKDTGGAGWSFPGSYGRSFFAPTWTPSALLHLTFDHDSATATDYSGRGRAHLWTGGTGGTRAHDATLVPGGGESVVAGTGSGWNDADWTAMDYIGDNAGLNSASLTYEYVVTFPTLATVQTVQEGGNGMDFWSLKVTTAGAVQYTISTDALAYIFSTPDGTITAGATQYTIQFALTNGGQDGQFFIAPRTAAFAVTPTTRSDI